MAQAAEVELVYFEDALWACSVQDEAAELSREAAEVLLGHLAKIKRGAVNPDRLRIWRSYRGVPVILAEYNRELLVYTSERKAPTMVKISLMFAGDRDKGYAGQDGNWDGSDDMLWNDIIVPRCRMHFS